MASPSDGAFGRAGRTVSDVQRAASAALCVVAAGLAVLTATSGAWPFAALFLAGLAAAGQSYRAALENAPDSDALEP